MTIPGGLPPWPREELRAAHATIGDLRLRLAATERHCHDLQAIVETLRGQLADVNTALAAAYEESAALRGQLAEAGAIRDLLPPTDRPVWQP